MAVQYELLACHSIFRMGGSHSRLSCPSHRENCTLKYLKAWLHSTRHSNCGRGAEDGKSTHVS
jgi:hypothetical protein